MKKKKCRKSVKKISVAEYLETTKFRKRVESVKKCSKKKLISFLNLGKIE